MGNYPMSVRDVATYSDIQQDALYDLVRGNRRRNLLADVLGWIIRVDW